VSLTIDAAAPPKSGAIEAPHSPASLTAAAGFAAALRDFTELDEKQGKRFARINAFLRAGPAYPDPVGCRSWLVW
jgi:hypothetical protein